jgi:hypothetical protein
LTIVGPTGSGKTVLARYLLRRRRFVVILGIKRQDKELYPPFQADGYRITHKFDLDDDASDNDPKVIFVPRSNKHGTDREKDLEKAFRIALNEIMETQAEGGEGWTVYADDVQYMSYDLHRRAEFREILLLGRSEDKTMVGSSQEPVDIPLQFYGNATRLFLFKNPDKRRAERQAELTGANRDAALATLLRLPQHQFLYVNRDTGQMLTSIVIR